MDIDRFIKLTLPERCKQLEGRGIYLKVSYRLDNLKIALFHLEDYYVEVSLNLSSNQIISAQPFTDYSRLDPFLDSIDISFLYADP